MAITYGVGRRTRKNPALALARRYLAMRRRAPAQRVPVARARRGRVYSDAGIETKFYDTSLVLSALTAPTDASGGEKNPSATICLNSVVQGDGESNRDGRQITMKSIQIKGSVVTASQSTQSTADSAASCFIALVLDTQTNGALLNSEDVFTNPSANAAGATTLFRDLQFAKRFKVLATRQFTLGNPGIANDTGATGGLVQNGLRKDFQMFVPLNNIRTLYSGTTETIANITDNSLNIIAFCSTTTQAPALTYNARLRFVG